MNLIIIVFKSKVIATFLLKSSNYTALHGAKVATERTELSVVVRTELASKTS